MGQGDFGAAGWSLSEALAKTATCVWSTAPDTLHSFKIKLNEDAPLYSGDDDPPLDKWDMESIMAHEFGHATGRDRSPSGNGADGHFAESSTYCPGSGSSEFGSRHTMCPSIFDGTRMQRSLEQHDRDIFQNAYD